MSNLHLDQFSFKNILYSVFYIIGFIKKHYIKLVLGSVVGGFSGLFIEYQKYNDITYKSEIVFVLEGENGSGGGISDIASSLGIGSSMGVSSSLFSGENFKELLKTKAIYKKAILTKVKFGNKVDIFGNFFLSKSKIDKYEWKNLPSDFYTHRFTESNPQKISIQDRNILDLIYENLKSKTSITIENPKSSFQTLAVEARSDTLAFVWSKLYLKTVTDFYIDTKTKKSQELLVILGKRVDSLRSALYFTQGKLANYNDQNQQIIFQSARIIAERLQMNSSQIQAMYLESVRNYDNLKFSQVKEAPLFNVISDTELPLITNKHSWGPITMVGFFLGFLISALIVYIIGVYKELIS
jgi:hypothetical protein